MTQETPPQINPASSTAKGFAASLTKNAGAAAKLVGLQAERTKLTSMTLPAAYRALGKDCIQQKRHLDGVKELVEQLRTVTSELSSLAEAPKADSSNQSFTDKAKAAGKQAVDLARKKQLEMKRGSLCGDVGKAIYETHKESSGSNELVSPIQAAINRVAELDSEIAKVEKGSLITSKYLLFVAAGIVVTVVFALFFPGKSKTQSEGIDKQSSTTKDNSQGDSEFESGYAYAKQQLQRVRLVSDTQKKEIMDEMVSRGKDPSYSKKYREGIQKAYKEDLLKVMRGGN